MESKTTLDLIDKDGWFLERNTQWPGIANSFQVKEILLFKKTKFQELLIFESTKHGRILVLDGVIQLTERDEFPYHEMLVNLPLMAHPNPLKVLVVGAGDGGIIRELCKHEYIKEIVWVEIDEDVVTFCEKYLPFTSCSNRDKRVKLLIEDGIKYVKSCKDEQFDCIITDSGDPEGPAQVLFSDAFYGQCHRILKPGGVLCSQAECVWNNLGLISRLIKNCRSLFKGGVGYSIILTSQYPSSQIGALVCKKYCPVQEKNQQLGVEKPVRPIPSNVQNSLKYYNEKLHSSSMVLPQFVLSKL